MIRQIRGTILTTEPKGAVIEVAGFGLLVGTTTDLSTKIGEEITLATYLAVKQDGMDLYGFADSRDRDFFELTLSVPGIGPKTALALLRKAPRENLISAMARKDLPYLTRVAGLGKKSAEKLVVLLAEKLSAGSPESANEDTEVLDTLVALGYTEREARAAIAKVPETVVGKEARLRAALGG